MEPNANKIPVKPHKTKDLKSTRKYDIIDLLIISVYNALVFMSGMAVGWLVWKLQW